MRTPKKSFKSRMKNFRYRAALAMIGGYAGASQTARRMFGFNPTTADADKWLKYDRNVLINRSHALIRDNPIIGGTIDTNCMNIVGAGLFLQSRIDADILGLNGDQAESLENQIEREFKLFSESSECDLAAINNFYDQQELGLRMTFASGEIFPILTYLERRNFPYGLKIQLVESERVCNQNGEQDGKRGDNYLYDGIEKNSNGEPIAYWICSDYPNSTEKGSPKWDRIPAFGSKTNLKNVLHVYKQLRPGQSRGVPYLSPIIEPLYNLGKYSKAELDAAVVAALFTVFLKTTLEGEEGSGIKTQDNLGGLNTDTDLKLGPGAILTLRPNEDVSTANPGRPNANFDPFFQAVLRQIGIGLGIPYEVMIKHYTSSYSAARAAMLEAWRFYKTRRQWFARKFCQPIFEAFMYEAVAKGRISAPGFFDDLILRQAYLGAEWVGPSQGHIDPVKEVTAAKIRMETGITTLAQETTEYSGGQMERNMRQIKKETALKADAGLVSGLQGTTTIIFSDQGAEN